MSAGDKLLQLWLRAAGHDPGPIDGIYGPKTGRAVVAFQQQAGLSVDGIVGPKTCASLYEATGVVAREWRICNNTVYALGFDRKRYTQRMVLGRPQPVSRHARGHIAAINGGFFDLRSGLPIGATIYEGTVVNDLADNRAGEWAILDVDNLRILRHPGRASLLAKSGVENCVASYTRLIVDGKADIGRTCWNLRRRQPRSAIGWSDAMLWFVVADGRRHGSAGLTLTQLRDVTGMALNTPDLHGQAGWCNNAMSLDGGGSSTLVWQGHVINHPSDGRERPVPTAIVID